MPSFDSILSIVLSTMNHMVVGFSNEAMKGQAQAQAQGSGKAGAGTGGAGDYLSDSALLCYCRFHHLLLTLNDVIPGLGAHASAHVERFVSEPACRLKASTPNLGNLSMGNTKPEEDQT